MVLAMIEEITLRHHEVQDKKVETLYFGGGTPSLLSIEELHSILETIYSYFEVSTNAEITLEANPDDLSLSKLQDLKAVGINRLSIGIQTFDEKRLSYINRAHTKEEAINSLQNARKAGFNNLSADLIYAIPPEGMDYWKNDLNTLISMDLEHISLYGLTIEEKTAFGAWKKKGKLYEVSEDLAAQQYELAINMLVQNGYEHYEVSNFCKPDFFSRHNTSYWSDVPYLGIGPGAHSYDGFQRSYNISHNAKYLRALESKTLPVTLEEINENDRLNDYIFTRLRTNKGLNHNTLKEKFNVNLIEDHQDLIDTWLTEQLVVLNEGNLTLTSRGFMIADEITWRLFYDS